ncbi:hypothetical protein [Virgisporangium aliadipatigenens]|nr:hypothetical protein [Virgisporangium aliadipatigenens]
MEFPELVAFLRAELDRRADGFLFADFPPGLPPQQIPADLPAGLRAAFEVTNGATAGVLTMIKVSGLEKAQSVYRDVAEFVDEPSRWLTVGAQLRTRGAEPRHRRAVVVPDTGVAWYESDRFEELAPDVATLFTDIVFTERYLELAPEPGEWYDLLGDLGLRT